jgi:hypothetical protein
MYQASVPAFVQMLNNLSAILDKAEAYAKNRKIDPEVLLNYRLAPDMLPLSGMIARPFDKVPLQTNVERRARAVVGSLVASWSMIQEAYSQVRSEDESDQWV